MASSVLEQIRAVWRSTIPVKAVIVATFVLICIWLLLSNWWRFSHEPFADKALGIRQLILNVRDELAGAEDDMLKAKRSALFDLKEMEMEINFVVHAGGDAKVEVVGVGGGLETSSEKIQKLKLRWAVAEKKSGTAARGGVTGGPTEQVNIQAIPDGSADKK